MARSFVHSTLHHIWVCKETHSEPWEQFIGVLVVEWQIFNRKMVWSWFWRWSGSRRNLVHYHCLCYTDCPLWSCDCYFPETAHIMRYYSNTIHPAIKYSKRNSFNNHGRTQGPFLKPVTWKILYTNSRGGKFGGSGKSCHGCQVKMGHFYLGQFIWHNILVPITLNFCK